MQSNYRRNVGRDGESNTMWMKRARKYHIPCSYWWW